MGSCTSVSTKDYKGDYPNFALDVVSKISGDPEKCLFDYQYNNCDADQDKISSCDAQVKTNCFLHAMQSEPGDDEEENRVTSSVHARMLAFTFTQGKFWVFNGKETDKDLSWETLKDRAWVVMNKIHKNKQNCIIKNNKYKIHDGDVIRFGKVLFKVNLIDTKKNKKKNLACEKKFDLVEKHSRPVRKIEDFASTKTVFGNGNEGLKNKLTTKLVEKGISSTTLNEQENEAKSSKRVDTPEEKACRICYCNEDEPVENPLIAPCDCSGSVKYIHLACAKAWINEQLTQDISPSVKSYCWERISCELCHSNFKEVVEHKGKDIKLFEKEKMDPNTKMVLESIYPDDIKINFSLIVKKHEEWKSFQVGRSRNCNIKLNLDSISRNHAEIKYDNGHFYLKDCMSTFGTMVLLRQPLMFTRKGKEEAAIQSGPTLIEIKHGGPKKIEYTYTSKEGGEKKCAVYNDFRHKIPSDMRNFIDKNSEKLEVIRVEDVQINSKFISATNIPKMQEISEAKPVLSKASTNVLRPDNASIIQSSRLGNTPARRGRVSSNRNVDSSVSPNISPDMSPERGGNERVPSQNTNIISPLRISRALEEEKELDSREQVDSVESYDSEGESEESRSVEEAWRMVSSGRGGSPPSQEVV